MIYTCPICSMPAEYYYKYIGYKGVQYYCSEDCRDLDNQYTCLICGDIGLERYQKIMIYTGEQYYCSQEHLEIDENSIDRVLGHPIILKEIRHGLFLNSTVEIWDFSNLGLTEVPLEVIEYLSMEWIDQFIWNIDFSNNKIYKIPTELNMVILLFAYNEIHDIPIPLGLKYLQVLDLSHNKFTELPIEFISKGYNLVDLNFDNNFIEKINITDIKKLAEITTVTIFNNIQNFDISKLTQVFANNGTIDIEKMRFSKFKYKNIKIYQDLLKKIFVKEFHNLDKYYHRFFESLSIHRHDHYNNDDDGVDDSKFHKDGSNMFEKYLRKKMLNFGNIVDNLYFQNIACSLCITLTNLDRIEEFDKFVDDLLSDSIV